MVLCFLLHVAWLHEPPSVYVCVCVCVCMTLDAVTLYELSCDIKARNEKLFQFKTINSHCEFAGTAGNE